MLLAKSSVLMNQLYIRDFYTETYPKQVCILIEENVIRDFQEPNPVFPLGVAVHYLLIQ